MESDNFETHYKKLEAFSTALQENKVSVDELIPKMKEALSSIKICKGVLQKTKAQLQELNTEFAELDSITDDSNGQQ